MSELIQTGFDYAALPVDSAAQLRTWKIEIAAFTDTVESSLVQIGIRFQKAQEELSRQGVKGEGFAAWVKAETKYSLSNAYELINVTNRFKDQLLPKFGRSVLYALAAPSTPEAVIDKAVAKAESGEKVTVADVKDWKADSEALRQRLLEVEQDKAIEQQRNAEWAAQNKANRDKIQSLELDLLNVKPSIIEVEKIPADYEKAKAQAETLKNAIADLKKKQADLVQQQVTAKLREREKELSDLDRKTQDAETRLQALNKQIDRYSSIERMTRFQRELIEKTRSALVDLASHLEGMKPLENDPDTDRLWDALADMLGNGKLAIEHFRGYKKTATALLQGE